MKPHHERRLLQEAYYYGDCPTCGERILWRGAGEEIHLQFCAHVLARLNAGEQLPQPQGVERVYWEYTPNPPADNVTGEYR